MNKKLKALNKILNERNKFRRETQHEKVRNGAYHPRWEQRRYIK